MTRQPEKRNNQKIANGHGIDTYSADGNDPETVYELFEKLVDETRKGAGPKYVELKTYRWREHCGPNYDNDLGYRSLEEFKSWERNDPISVYREKLKKRGLINAKLEHKFDGQIAKEIAGAFQFAFDSDYPDHKEMAELTYG